jgi:hypothetical protein
MEHQPGGMPLSVFAMIDSVTSRPCMVRCGKWRPGVCCIRPLRIDSPICEPRASRRRDSIHRLHNHRSYGEHGREQAGYNQKL